VFEEKYGIEEIAMNFYPDVHLR